jgi:pyridoxal phosphate enzyme (YggS family)
VSPTEGAADDPLTGGIPSHLASVRRRIDAAAERAHRSRGDVLLVAVSKTFPADAVRAAAGAGQRDFGENRVQEGLDKIDVLRASALTWHLIGPLQTNKAKKAAAAFAWIQTLDRPDLLKKLDAAAHDLGARPRVLVQVNLAREERKHGTDEAAARDLVRAAIDARALDLRGLMIVPPFPTDPEDSRPWFRRLRELRDRLVSEGVPADRLRELSMGMSHDFEVAIEEGATMVRVGTAIFGRRTPPAPQP